MHLLPPSSLLRVIKECVCSFKSYNFTNNAKLVKLGIGRVGGRGAVCLKKKKNKTLRY